MFPLQFRCDIWETLLEVLEPPAAVRRTAARQHTLNLWLFHGRSAGMGIPQDSAKVMYLLTVPLYRSSLRSIDRFDSPSRWRRNACLILFISLHLPAMACSIYGWAAKLTNKWVAMLRKHCPSDDSPTKVGAHAPKSGAAAGLARYICRGDLPTREGSQENLSGNQGTRLHWILDSIL